MENAIYFQCISCYCVEFIVEIPKLCKKTIIITTWMAITLAHTIK